MAINPNMLHILILKHSGRSLNSQQNNLMLSSPLIFKHYTVNAFSAMFYRVNKALVSTKLCTDVLGTVILEVLTTYTR